MNPQASQPTKSEKRKLRKLRRNPLRKAMKCVFSKRKLRRLARESRTENIFAAHKSFLLRKHAPLLSLLREKS